MRLAGYTLATVMLATAGWAEGHDVTVAHGISAFGELKYPAGFPHYDYADPGAPKGGTISFRGQGASRTFDSLNYFILKGEPAQGLVRLYDTLLDPSYDEADAGYGLIAESLEYPEDRSWAVFNLRPEARFSDGVPLTAEDVVFTFETLRAEGRPYYAITLKDVESVTAEGPHRVRFDFADGVATRDLPFEVGQIQILPRHYYAEVPFDDSTLDPPVGSGPYVVDAVDAGRSVRYCRNPDYWGADLPVNVGRHNFECLVYEYFTDSTAAFEALKAGAYVFHEEFSSALWATNYDFPALDRGWVRREILPDQRASGAQGFWLNMRRDKLSDPRVREAVALMFNFEWSNQTLFYGSYRRTDSFWENSELQAEGMLEGAELAVLDPFRDRLPPEVFAEPAYSAPESGTQQVDRGNLRRASALLDDAGWIVGDDGLRRNAAGEPLTLDFLYDSPAFDRIIIPYVENLKRLGVNAVADRVDPAQRQLRLENFDYDFTVARLVLGLSPSGNLRTLFGSESVDAAGTLNLSGVNDPVVDALIDGIVAASSRDELIVRVRALDRVLRAMHIWVPNWFKGEHWLAYWDMFGRPAVKPPYDRGDEFWWFDQGKYDALVAAGAIR